MEHWDSAVRYLEPAYDEYKTTDLAWKLGVANFHLRDYRKAQRYFRRIARRDRDGEFPAAQLWMAKMMKMNGNYEEALGELNDIVKSDADPLIKQEAQLELIGANLALEAPEPTRITIENAGKEINSPGSEGSVFISPDGNTLYFTSFSQEEELPVDDLEEEHLSKAMRSEYVEDEGWGAGTALDEKINREGFHTGNIGIGPNGQEMYITRVIQSVDSMAESKIFISYGENGQWGPAYELSGVNGDWLAKNPCVGELFGNEVLYFSANIPGGHGGFDLYYARKNGENSYDDPVNLGTVINGPGDEVTPFYREGRLYFSSTTHPGFGGRDVFYSDWDGSTWSQPENMGMGINSSVDDFSFSVDATGYKGALLSNRPEGKSLYGRTCCDDIYSFTIEPVQVQLVASVQDGEAKGLLRGVSVQLIEMLEDKMGVTQAIPTGDKGSSTFTLDLDKAYRVIAGATGYYGDTLEFNTVGIRDDQTIEKMLVIMPIPKAPEYEVYTTEEPIRLNNIYYDYDDDKILADAEDDLQLLLDLLNQYPDMVIELSSHTDARGNDDYNQNLSQRRAQSAADWLIERGVVTDRIKPVGYGETKILNQCTNDVECTDEEHRFNRRTEFKIIAGPTSIRIEKKRLKKEE